MKRITIWSIAALSALAMTAVAGATSASAATVLCSNAESVCATANVLPAGKSIALGKGPTEGVFKIKAGIGASVTCKYAVINSVSTAEARSPLPGQSELGVYSKNCQNSLAGTTETCKSLTFNNPKETFEATGSGGGTINLGSKSEPLTVSFSCLSPVSEIPIECGYQANSAIPIHYVGSTGTIKSTESAMTRVSSNSEFCLASGSLEAALENSGEGAFISTHTATVLCGAAESVCASANILPAGQKLPLATATPIGEGKFMIRGAEGGVECEYAVINSVSTAEVGIPLPGKSEVGVNAKNCGTWLWWRLHQSCESITLNSPKETYEATGSGAGIIYLGSKAEPLTISFACYSPFTGEALKCSYKADSSVPIHYDGNRATIKKTEATTSLVSGPELCAATGSVEAEMVKAYGPYISTI